jgi:hypothetical protein
MKKIKLLSFTMFVGLCSLATLMFSPFARAESGVLQLPAGAYYANHGQTDATILKSLSIGGQGQIATVNPGQSVSVSYTMQIFANPTTPEEIRQAFFAYSWASSWPPFSAYTAIYDDTPGLNPGVTKTDTFTIAVPTTPGNYNVWFLGESQYSMHDAVAAHTSPPNNLPHARIIVESASIALSPYAGFASTTVVGSGFSSNSRATIAWDGTTIPSIPNPVTTDANGSFTAFISVPTQTTPGLHTVNATDEFGKWATATFTVVDMKGLQGLQGLTGAQGPKGDKGDNGAQGPEGSLGETQLALIALPTAASIFALCIAVVALLRKKT